jgi:hypothetical protein
MRKSTQFRPWIEKLESMTLPSGISAGPHGLAASVVSLATPAGSGSTVQVKLNGRLRGTYHVDDRLPDVGQKYTFFGHGRIGPVGTSDVTGHADSLGNVATGKAHGLIVISTPEGSLTLKLTGPTQKGLSHLPDRFSFKITNSSGAYFHDRGHGRAVLVLDPAARGADHGTFTLVLLA